MTESERAIASWICCPMCDMDFESTKGKCPGHKVCNEITKYLESCNENKCGAKMDGEGGVTP